MDNGAWKSCGMDSGSACIATMVPNASTRTLTATYSGDGDWTPDLATASDGADLFIAECYFYSKPVKWHLNYPSILEHKKAFNAKRMILTHMGPEMLAKAADVPEECAEDGMVVSL